MIQDGSKILRADAIKEVQVFNKKNDQAEFTELTMVKPKKNQSICV
jgi:hypothetical protein